jgi:hypothetical protein
LDDELTAAASIGEWEHIIVSNIKKLIPESVKITWHDWRESMKKAERQVTGSQEVSDHADMAGWGVEEAEQRNKAEASTCPPYFFSHRPQERSPNHSIKKGPLPHGWWRWPKRRDLGLATQLALAYAIHKSFIFIRVPLTAAVTPKVVKILRGWGWDIGKRTSKEVKAMNRAAAKPPAKKKR